jgi:predicted esterase
VPTLHVIGTADAVVPPEATRALAQHFLAAESVEHDKGHVAQLPAEARQRVVAFLHSQLDARTALPALTPASAAPE